MASLKQSFQRCLLRVGTFKKPWLQATFETLSVNVTVPRFRWKVIPHSWRRRTETALTETCSTWQFYRFWTTCLLCFCVCVCLLVHCVAASNAKRLQCRAGEPDSCHAEQNRRQASIGRPRAPWSVHQTIHRSLSWRNSIQVSIIIIQLNATSLINIPGVWSNTVIGCPMSVNRPAITWDRAYNVIPLHC